jgi:hypothetical protein
MLIHLMPTQEEAVAATKDIIDENRLEPYDRFFLRMSRIPRCKQHMDALKCQVDVPALVEDLRSKIKVITKACNEIKSSSNFRTFLKVVLRVARELESVSGTNEGFSLSSLANLHVTKAFDKKTSMLQYIENYLFVNFPGAVSFHLDMPSVSDAMRVEFNDLQNLRRDIFSLMTMVENEMAVSLNDAISKEGKQHYFLSLNFEKIHLIVFLVYKTAGERAIASSEARLALTPFIDDAKVQLKAVDDDLATMQTAYSDCLRFFGELSNVKSHEYFAQIQDFLTTYAEVHNKNDRTRESEKRKARRSSKVSTSAPSSTELASTVSVDTSPAAPVDSSVSAPTHQSFLSEERQVLNVAHSFILNGVTLNKIEGKEEEK